MTSSRPFSIYYFRLSRKRKRERERFDARINCLQLSTSNIGRQRLLRNKHKVIERRRNIYINNDKKKTIIGEGIEEKETCDYNNNNNGE